MKVFISWSGETSRLLADILRGWMPAVLQAVKPYFTPDDIAKGARWAAEISRELETSSVGLVCLTADNLESPWIMFEAGALSRSVDRANVCPILFDVTPTDVKGPLLQFQAAPFQKTEMKRVMAMINGKLAEGALAQDVFDRVFEMWWPMLDESVSRVVARRDSRTVASTRSDRDLLEEAVSLARATVDRLQSAGPIEDVPAVRHTTYWPPILRRAMTVLSKLRDEALTIHPQNEFFEEKFRTATRELGIEGVKELQASVVDSSRVFVYHDWPDMIGTRAAYRGEDGVDVYDEVMRYPSGTVAWADRSSNIRPLNFLMVRFNVAVFTTCAETGCRVIVEAHEEIPLSRWSA